MILPSEDPRVCLSRFGAASQPAQAWLLVFWALPKGRLSFQWCSTWPITEPHLSNGHLSSVQSPLNELVRNVLAYPEEGSSDGKAARFKSYCGCFLRWTWCLILSHFWVSAQSVTVAAMANPKAFHGKALIYRSVGSHGVNPPTRDDIT